MRTFLEMLVFLPPLVVCYQLYSFSVSSQGEQKQGRCQILGIGFMTIGITALVYKSVPSAFFGLVLMMLGFRLIARGLDRLDKKVYIDRFQDEPPES